jgi:hypothetical protein
LILDVSHSFVVFGDDGTLSTEPVDGADLVPIKATEAAAYYASCTWSSDCEWYFVVVTDGIALLNIDGTGYFCRKRSAEFIRLFVEAPKRRRGRPRCPVQRE